MRLFPSLVSSHTTLVPYRASEETLHGYHTRRRECRGGRCHAKAYQKFICTISFPFQASPCCHPRECRKKVVEIFPPAWETKLRAIFSRRTNGARFRKEEEEEEGNCRHFSPVAPFPPPHLPVAFTLPRTVYSTLVVPPSAITVSSGPATCQEI